MGDVRLETFSRVHLGVIAELAVDPEVQRFSRIPVPTPTDFADVWWSRLEDGRRNQVRESFAVIDDGDGRVLGIAGVPKIDHEARTAELGYLIAPFARGRGVATQALAMLTSWALTELLSLRLELLISDQNPASRKVAIRCGYRLEGVLRSLHLKGDIRYDTEIWSRLPTDP